MSTATLPTYPDLFTLDPSVLEQIQDACIKQSHLSPSDKLLDVIQSNLITLSAHGLTKLDIYYNHRNMYLKFNMTDNFDAYSEEEGVDLHVKSLIESCPSRAGWSCHGNSTNEIILNGQHLRITCLVWGGAERCPIECHFDEKYHGYERGDRDWFVTNLTTKAQIWIPDLLPAQIGMFGFSQSKDLPYHLDLEKYIDIMGIKGPIEVLPTVREARWRSNGSVTYTPEYIAKNYSTVKEETHDNYQLMLTTRKEVEEETEESSGETTTTATPETSKLDPKIYLFVKFTNASWLTANLDAYQNIFDGQLHILSYHNEVNTYYQFDKGSQLRLAEGDQSDKIRSKTKGRCVII